MDSIRKNLLYAQSRRKLEFAKPATPRRRKRTKLDIGSQMDTLSTPPLQIHRIRSIFTVKTHKIVGNDEFVAASLYK
jgi:hypothetical protein